MNNPSSSAGLASLLYSNNAQNDSAYAAQMQAILAQQGRGAGFPASYLGAFTTPSPDNSLLLLLTDE